METIYLDHNILDALLKKRDLYLDDYYEGDDVVFIYSKETLVEIHKSKGGEKQFLDQLVAIGAYYLFVETNMEGRVTGRWEIVDADPYHEFAMLDEALSDGCSSESLFGLGELMQKFNGGLEDKTFSQIAQEGAQEIEEMLDNMLKEVADEVDSESLSYLVEQFEGLKSNLYEKQSEMGSLLDSGENSNDIAGWEQFVEIGPRELKNIKGPNIVSKIWECIAQKVPDDITFNKICALEPVYDGAYVPKHVSEKCDRVYHGLNYLGYYRDKGMKKLGRITAAMSDMTHVGYAALCTKLLSDDKDLCKKAEAVYEYLNINTEVVYANLNGKKQKK
ncbi:MAG: hypothetical protein MJK04_06420 [Psychrosphaera sp.]|nr:hypothetical protein [Psychrosphaera sp.]